MVLGFVVLASCSAGDEPPASTDPCVTGRFRASIAVESPDDVDLLFVIDDSGSMADEQMSLAIELPRLVHTLTSGDRTGNGPTADDFAPVASLHLGVITSDMGTGGFSVPSCVGGRFGDDGLLRARGDTSAAGCLMRYPAFLEYEPGISAQTPQLFGADFRCVAHVGTSGCSIEQPLEALLKALTPSTSPLVFSGDTRGHGDLENAGFLRASSIVGLFVVTDEDDCSVTAGAEDFFDDASSTYVGELDTRCHRYREAQWDVSRYVEGLHALRPGRESLLVFGAIAGVPVDLVTFGTPNYAAILSDARMVETTALVPEPTSPTDNVGLEPSCNVPGVGLAFPPRRLVEVARSFGENGSVQSICQSSYSGALDAFTAKIGDELAAVCLPYDLEQDAAGLVNCDLLAVIPPPGTYAGQPTSCAEVPGAELARSHTNADGSIECEVAQLSTTGGVVPTGMGWYYDDFTAHNLTRCGHAGQHIAFPRGATPPLWTTVELDCQITCTTTADCPFYMVCGSTSAGHVCVDPSCIDGA